jgi:hypothetical protein
LCRRQATSLKIVNFALPCRFVPGVPHARGSAPGEFGTALDRHKEYRRFVRQMKTRTRFTVEGSGAFPFDMLRYDCCWPENESDSPNVGLMYDTTEYIKTRRITLLSDNQQVPTDSRWKMFGWKVVGIGRLTVGHGKSL